MSEDVWLPIKAQKRERGIDAVVMFIRAVRAGEREQRGVRRGVGSRMA